MRLSPLLLLVTPGLSNGFAPVSFLSDEDTGLKRKHHKDPLPSLMNRGGSSPARSTRRYMSMSIPSFIDVPTVIAVVSTSLLIYNSWSDLPNWARVFSRVDNSEENWDANDDLANPAAVIDKLREMISLALTETDEATPDSLSYWKIAASFYSLIHLNKEIRAIDADYRDKQYDDDRKDDDVQLPELRELMSTLDYAQWAYETDYVTISNNCRKAGLDLLRHDTATEPGQVGHFIAMDHKNKVAIVGLKGTSTLADALTDLVAVPEEHCCDFDALVDGEGQREPRKMYCHEGINTAALWMADDIEDTIRNIVIPLKYKLLITGHSLGAGAACLLGLELRARIKELRNNFTDLRVLAFATPAVLSFQASKACAPFITSVINNSDIVPRASLSNLVVMNKLVVKVNDKLNAKGLDFNSWLDLKNYYKDVSRVDDQLLLSTKELDEWFDETHAAPEIEPDHLYVPGRCVVLWDKGENDNGEIGGIVTDCGMKMLRQIELSDTMVNDHMVDVYRGNMDKLIKQLEAK